MRRFSVLIRQKHVSLIMVNPGNASNAKCFAFIRSDGSGSRLHRRAKTSLKVGIESLFRLLFTPCSVTALFLTVFVFSSFDNDLRSLLLVSTAEGHTRGIWELKSQKYTCFLLVCILFIKSILLFLSPVQSQPKAPDQPIRYHRWYSR